MILDSSIHLCILTLPQKLPKVGYFNCDYTARILVDDHRRYCISTNGGGGKHCKASTLSKKPVLLSNNIKQFCAGVLSGVKVTKWIVPAWGPSGTTTKGIRADSGQVLCRVGDRNIAVSASIRIATPCLSHFAALRGTLESL